MLWSWGARLGAPPAKPKYRPWKLRFNRALYTLSGERIHGFSLQFERTDTVPRKIWCTVARVPWRDCILRIYWDDQEQPSVECPIGDFFAASVPAAVLVCVGGALYIAGAVFFMADEFPEIGVVSPESQEGSSVSFVVHVPDVATDDRWPGYTDAAAAAGVASVLGVPFELNGEARAALNIYADQPHSYDQDAIEAFVNEAPRELLQDGAAERRTLHRVGAGHGQPRLHAREGRALKDVLWQETVELLAGAGPVTRPFSVSPGGRPVRRANQSHSTAVYAFNDEIALGLADASRDAAGLGTVVEESYHASVPAGRLAVAAVSGCRRPAGSGVSRGRRPPTNFFCPASTRAVPRTALAK